MRNCLDLTGRVAVVIGATSGIGRQIALGLAEHGADVAPTGRRLAAVEEACCTVESLGRRALGRTTDVRDRQSIDALRDAVLDRFGGVDILVNAAGYTFMEPTATMCEERWSSLIDTNLSGALRACQSFYEPLKASGRGRIVNIASLGSYLAFYRVAAYCAAKSALLSLTRSLAIEWARDGISVNAIAPGVFPTELNSELVNETLRGQELLTRTPMGRFGRPVSRGGRGLSRLRRELMRGKGSAPLKTARCRLIAPFANVVASRGGIGTPLKTSRRLIARSANLVAGRGNAGFSLQADPASAGRPV